MKKDFKSFLVFMFSITIVATLVVSLKVNLSDEMWRQFEHFCILFIGGTISLFIYNWLDE